MDKTFVFEGGGSAGSDAMLAALMNKSNNLDPNLVAALMNNKDNNGFGEGGWLWILLLFFLGGNRGFGFGNNGVGAEIASDNCSRDLILQATQGNRTAIAELASVLNTDINSIQTALCGIDKTLAQLSGQVGLSTQQIINSIQSGNTQLMSQMASCCGEVKTLITQQGYENQIATLNQTNTLQNQASANTAAIIAKVDAFEDRYRQDKLNALEAENLALKGRISQSEQNQFIYASVNAAVNPIKDQINSINADIQSFKCKLPDTVSLPTIPGNIGLWGYHGVNLGGCDNGLGNLGGCGLGC